MESKQEMLKRFEELFWDEQALDIPMKDRFHNSKEFAKQSVELFDIPEQNNDSIEISMEELKNQLTDILDQCQNADRK
jgi:hypothetical protein